MIPPKKSGNYFNLSNSMSLPYINSVSKKQISQTNFKKDLLNSPIKEQKYKLDVKRFTYNLNSKKKMLDSLKKECEKIKNIGKSSNKTIEIPLKFDSNEYEYLRNSDRKIKILNRNKQRDEKVKSYKETKANLELSRYEYNTRNHENIKIKSEIKTIDDEIKNIENKINERNNDVKNIKIKIGLAKKNNKEIMQLLEDGKERNIKLNYIKELEIQKNINLNKLKETNQIINKNQNEINELKKILEKLRKNK